MIEARTPNAPVQTTETTTMETPQTITTSMILADLENGIDRPGIKAKYNLEGWELTEMFKHPVLKGKKASRKRKMSFNFVDDTPTQTLSPEAPTEAQADVDEVVEDLTNVDTTTEYTDAQMNSMYQDVEDAQKSQEAEQAASLNDFSNGFDA